MIKDKNYSRFLVLAHPRSGSSLLITLLRSHGNVVAHGEVFNDSECDLSPLSRPDMDHANLIARREKDPIQFINDFVFTDFPSWKTSVGFKIHYIHAKTANSIVWKYLSQEPSIKIIHLIRSNSLETFVSLQTAMKTNRWAKTCDTPVATTKLSLGRNQCENFFKRVKQYRAHFNQLFSDHSIISVEYNDLNINKCKTLERVQEFIGIEVEDLQSDLRKQNTRRLSEIVENYYDLKSHFAKTEWSVFFKD